MEVLAAVGSTASAIGYFNWTVTMHFEIAEWKCSATAM